MNKMNIKLINQNAKPNERSWNTGNNRKQGSNNKVISHLRKQKWKFPDPEMIKCLISGLFENLKLTVKQIKKNIIKSIGAIEV